MNIEAELALSYYKDVAEINSDHGVSLVQHRDTKLFYVKKILDVFDIDVYIRLKEKPLKGIPQIHELFRLDEKLLVIEEYIPGDNLEQLLQSKGSFTEDEALEIILELCDIVEGLHSMNPPIIHRDIKPGNVIISNDKTVYLLDLNAARLDDQHQAEDTVLLGTKGYAAPEQYGFGSSDVTTDIYAIGMLMNTLLTGKLSRENIATGRFERIIKKCVSIDRSDRYSSISDLVNALTDSEPRNHKWTDYLPPGFRSGKIYFMLPATLLYLLLAAGLNGIYDGDVTKGINPWIDTIGVGLGFVLTILFVSNYLDVHRHFPFLRKMHPVARWFAVAGIAFMILMVCFMVTIFLSSTFNR